jgi:hypothetical protein
MACADPDGCAAHASSTARRARVARYDKIHLFAFARGEERYDEAGRSSLAPKPWPSTCRAAASGLSVCYDLRFPELYRGMGTLALILVPAAFTATTGAAHWHSAAARPRRRKPVLRPRGRAGRRASGGRRTYGHSLLIDPWGAIVAEHDQGTGNRRRRRRSASACRVREELPALDAPGAVDDKRQGDAIRDVAVTDRHFEDFAPGRSGGIRSDCGRRDGGHRVRAPVRSATHSYGPGRGAAGPFGG